MVDRGFSRARTIPVGNCSIAFADAGISWARMKFRAFSVPQNSELLTHICRDFVDDLRYLHCGDGRSRAVHRGAD